MYLRITILLIWMASSVSLKAQTDSLVNTFTKVPDKFFKEVDSKIDKYSKRISSKTEKTLTKLSRWETKIKSLLEKTNPETAAKLFGNNQTSFTSLLQQLKKGESITQGYKAQYSDYRDKLTTGLKYIEQQKEELGDKYAKPAKGLQQKMQELDGELAQSEALDKFIKERKKQLIDEAIKHIGKSKYLVKINKEAYYYAETMRNYKEIFNDPKKAEETVINLLIKVPAFNEFFKKNSMLSSLFRMPENYGTPQSLAGLQTRASVNALIQDRIAAGGPNAREMFSQNMQAAQAELNKLKDKILKTNANGGWDGGPSPSERGWGEVNTQKTKTFFQRLELTPNLQFGKPNGYLPSTADMGMNIGYKLNDKSTIGLGAAYKLGMGSIQKIKFSTEGIGLRSFIDWKLVNAKGKIFSNFYLSGGYERNYFPGLRNIAFSSPLGGGREGVAWQQSGLIGLSKKIELKTKFSKSTKFQLYYDMLHQKQVPVGQAWVFRVGYGL
ncbi:MAG: hypothetical protein WAT19_00895 [Ferruginibacter sp.]